MKHHKGNAVESHDPREKAHPDDHFKRRTSPAKPQHLIALVHPPAAVDIGTKPPLSLNHHASILDNVSFPAHTTATVTSAANDKIDDELKKLKHKAKLLPITDEEQRVFWDTIHSYQKLHLIAHRSSASNQSTSVGFNMEAAWNRMVCMLHTTSL